MPAPPVVAQALVPGAVKRLASERVFARAIAIWARRVLPYSAVALVLGVPDFLLERLLGEGSFDWLASSLSNALSSVAIGAALTPSAVAAARGAPLRFDVRAAARAIPAALSVGLVVTLLTWLGLAALVVPGVFAYVLWFVAVPAAIVEGLGVGAALRRSLDLTRGARGRILLLVVCVPLLLLLLAVLTAAVLLAFTGGPAQAASLTEDIFGGVARLLVVPIFAVANAVVYVELRLAREGTLSEDIDRVFG